MSKRINRPFGSPTTSRPKSASRPSRGHQARGARGVRHTQKNADPEAEELEHEPHTESDEESRRLRLQKVAEKHDKDDGHEQGDQGQAKSQLNKRLLEQQRDAQRIAQLKSDAFKVNSKGSDAVEHAKLQAPSAPQVPVRAMTSGNALHFLNNAKEPGELFRRVDPDAHGGHGGQGQSEDESGPDAELLAAVAELAEKLAGVRGVEGVAPGMNDQGVAVVLVLASPGLTHTSFDERIPPTVGRFETLVALPYEALPLRRERWG